MNVEIADCVRLCDEPLMLKVLDHGYVKLVDWMPKGEWTIDDIAEGKLIAPGDQAIVDAARVSYAKGVTRKRSDQKLLRYLYENDHLTPFEMVQFKFEVKLPIFVARQWMRHRSFSYNEVSARYTEVACQYYTPPVWRLQDEKNRQGSADQLGEHDSQSATLLYRENVEAAIQAYVKLMESGVARELARMVLPQSMYTTFVFSCDYRNLLNFLKLRMDSHAQWEIQRYATAIMHLLMPVVPYSIGMVFDTQEIEQKTNVAGVNDLELSRKMGWTLVNDDRGLGFIGSAPLLGSYMIHFALHTPHPLELVAFIENKVGTVVARATGKSHFDALANLMRKRLTEGGRRYSDFLGYSDALITEVFGE